MTDCQTFLIAHPASARAMAAEAILIDHNPVTDRSVDDPSVVLK
jgi:hypothetical protein